MFLDEYNPSFWKMIVVWYSCGLWLAISIWSNNRSTTPVMPTAAQFIAAAIAYALLQHIHEQNFILFVVTTCFTIIAFFISWLVLANYSEGDLGMFCRFALAIPITVALIFAIVGMLLGISHWVLSWLVQ